MKTTMINFQRNADAVEILSSGNSNGIMAQLEDLKKQLASLEKITETPWKTNGEYGDGFANIKDKDAINIPLEDLICMEAGAYQRKLAYDAAVSRLPILKGKSVPIFTIEGFPYEDWNHDVNLRISINLQKETHEALAALIKEGEQFIEKEDLKSMWQKKLNQATGNLNSLPASTTEA